MKRTLRDESPKILITKRKIFSCAAQLLAFSARESAVDCGGGSHSLGESRFVCVDVCGLSVTVSPGFLWLRSEGENVGRSIIPNKKGTLVA